MTAQVLPSAVTVLLMVNRIGLSSSPAVCDTSMAGLIDLLGHLNSLPYKTNETNAHGIHDYLVGVCKVMRENVDRATAGTYLLNSFPSFPSWFSSETNEASL